MFYIIPYYFIYLSVIGSINEQMKYFFLKKIVCILIYLIYLGSSYKIMSLFKNELPWFFMFYIRPVHMMEYLGLIGILLSAILSGYGSTHCILNYIIYPFFKSINIFKIILLKKYINFKIF